MAKILAPYSLCPLIEHKNFLGVSDDALSDCVIVTLSRNMVIRFRLSDQKQLSSWSTRYKLTAPVVYDFFNNRYIGVFNCDEVSFWHDSLEQLNKLKKYKFTWLIHSIVSSKDLSPHIVYMNGSISPLSVDRETRKEPTGDFLPTTENIEDVKIVSIQGTSYVSLCTFSQKEERRTLYFVPTSDGKEKIAIKLERKDKDVKILSYTVVESEVSTYLITLWSDGDFNSLELPPDEAGLPGRLVGKVDFIDLTTDASLFPISGDQVAIYGAQSNSEGGILAIFSLKFGVIETSEKLKVYNNVRKALARSRELIIPSGPNLLVLPYKLYTARLAGLIGSQAPPVCGTVENLREQGVAESRISETLLPDLIESKNAEGVLNILKNCHDIPDKSLVSALAFALSLDPNDISDSIIQTILTRPLIGDNLSLSLIRAYIPLNSVLLLLGKLKDIISENIGDKVPIEWASLLLDSHYQQYLLSKDSNIIETMKKLIETIDSQLEYMEELKLLNWEILNMENGQRQLKKPSISSLNYVIETMQLY